MAAKLLTRDVHDVDVHVVAPEKDNCHQHDRQPGHDSEEAVTEGAAAGEEPEALRHSQDVPTRPTVEAERRHGQGVGGVR